MATSARKELVNR